MKKLIEKSFQTRNEQYNQILSSKKFIDDCMSFYELVKKTLNNNGKLILCGNGGSAADCLHIAGEFVGRLTKERAAWPAISICSDIAVITCLGNDYSFENVFKRQIEALSNKNDLVICLSTSGNSLNIVNALKTARSLGVGSCSITNNLENSSSISADFSLKIPSNNTQIIQEVTILLFHIICEMLENE